VVEARSNIPLNGLGYSGPVIVNVLESSMAASSGSEAMGVVGQGWLEVRLQNEANDFLQQLI
jgi:hypothetical protein